jgi:PAS domain S-box-containing protein
MSDEFRLVIVEDGPTDRELSVRELRKAGLAPALRFAEDEAELRAALAEFDPDVVITGHALPRFNGHRAIQVVKEVAPTTPVIVLTGSLGEESSVEYMRSGADDYVLKANIERLAPAVRRALAEKRTRDEKRQAEESLRESEDRYHQLFEAGSDAVFLIDNETGRLLEANSAASALYGYPHEELLAMKNADLSAEPEQTQKVTQTTPVAAERVVRIPLRYHRKKDGTVFPVEITGRFFNWQGRPVHIATIRDITGRRQAEETLHTSEAILGSIFRAAPIGIGMVVDRVLLFVNNALCDMSGYSRDELVGQSARILYSSDEEFERVGREKYIDIRERGSGSIATQFKRKTGELLDVWLSSVAIDPADLGKGVTFTAMDVTERKRAEESLYALSARQEALLSAVPDIIMEVDGNKVYTWANQAGLEFFGEDVVGREAAFYFEGEQDTYGLVKPLFNGREDVIYVESWQRRRDGQKRLLAWWCRVLKDENGNVIGALSTARDITEHKKMEQEIQRRRVYLENVLACAPDAVVALDAEGRVVEWNDGAERLFGYTRDEALGRHIDDLVASVDPTVKQTAMGMTERILAGETVSTSEIVRYRKDGAPITAIAAGAPIVVDGKVTGIVAVYTDITERKGAEEALLRERDLVARIMETSPSAILMLDRQGQITFANRQAEQVMGLTRDEITQRTYNAPTWRITSYDGSPFPEEQLPFQRVMGTSQPVYDVRHMIEWPDGRRVLLSINAAPLFDGSGQPDGMVATVEDITERTRTERVREVMYRIADAANQTEDLAELAESIRKYLGEVIDTTNFYVALYDPATNMISLPYHADEADDIAGFPAGKSLTAYVIRNNEPLLATQEVMGQLEASGKVKVVGAPSKIWMGAPLRVKGDVIGVVAVQSYTDPERYSRNDLDILSFVSDQIAVAIQRKQAEAALRESERRYQTLANVAPVGIFRTDAVGQTTYVNPRWCEISGASLQDALGDAWLLNVHPDDRDRIVVQWKEAVASGADSTSEYRFVRPDGSLAWVMGKAVPETGAEGRIVGYVGTITDITELKRMEEALRRRAEELAALQETVLEITAAHELPAVLRAIVERAAALLGAPSGGLYLCDPERREARCVLSYNTPRDYTGAVLKYGEGAAGIVAETGKPLIIDNYCAWSNRATVYDDDQPFSAVISAPMIWQGQVTGVIHVLHSEEGRRFTQGDLELLTLFANHAAIAAESARLYDAALRHAADLERSLAELTSAQEALRESEERFRSLYENAVIGIYRTTPDGQIQMANPALMRMLGYESFGELSRRNLESEGYNSSFSRARFKERMEKDDQVIGLEAAWTRLDGSAIYVRESARAIRDANGKVLCYEGTVEDVTERKQAEEALLVQARELARSNAFLRALSQVAAQLETTRDPEQVMQTLGTGLKTLGLESLFGMVEPDGESLVFSHLSIQSRALALAEKALGFTVGEFRASLGIWPISDAVRQNKSVLVSDPASVAEAIIPHVPRKAVRLAAQAAGVTSEVKSIFMPLSVEDRVGGVLAVWGKDIREEDMAPLSVFAGQVAVALENARLYAAECQRVEELARTAEQLKRELTERKQAEEALRASEEKYRILVENAGEAIFVAQDGMVKFANDRTAEIIGYTKETLAAQPFIDFIHPDDRTLVMDRHERRQQGAVIPTQYSFRIMNASGDTRWVELNVVAIEWEGRPASLNFLSDITERKQAEADLLLQTMRLESLVGLHQLMNASEQEIMDFCLDATLKAVQSDLSFIGWIDEDESMLAIRAWSQGAMRQCAVGGELPHSPIADAGLWAECIRQRKPIIVNEYDAPLPGKRGYPEGHVPLKRLLSVPVIDGPRIVAVAAVANKEEPYNQEDVMALTALMNKMWEIVRRQQSERALHESEGRYRSLFEESPTPMREEDFSAVKARIEELRDSGITDFRAYFESHPEAVADCMARVITLDVNKAAMEMFGAKSKQELTGSLSGVIPEGGYDSFVTELVAISEGQSRFEGEVVNRTLSGEEIDAVLRWRAVPGCETTLAKVLVSIVDITERKRLEGRLLQSQKMETVGRLAGGIAHDFNNLLTAISGYATFALESLPTSDPVRADIEQVIKAGDRAAALTRQLLAFSRRQIIEMRATNLNDLILDIDKMLRRLISEDVELVTIPGDSLWPVKADPGQLEQVLVNLAVNARDAMPGGGTLTIETANASLDEEYARHNPGVEPGEYVLLAVSDTGTGMTDEVKLRLFEPFFTTKEVGKGTGLGLATVYGIVKQHGGNIYVYSEVGIGSTFKVYMPAVDVEAEGMPRRDAAGYLPRGSETVLVVEDEATLRALVVRALTELGYKCLEAGNGEEALRVAQAHPGPIHILLADVVMPQMGGKELAQQLQAARPDTRVLFASGYTGDAIVHGGMLGKGAAFLQKPFTTAALARKVREVLDRSM